MTSEAAVAAVFEGKLDIRHALERRLLVVDGEPAPARLLDSILRRAFADSTMVSTKSTMAASGGTRR